MAEEDCFLCTICQTWSLLWLISSCTLTRLLCIDISEYSVDDRGKVYTGRCSELLGHWEWDIQWWATHQYRDSGQFFVVGVPPHTIKSWLNVQNFDHCCRSQRRGAYYMHELISLPVLLVVKWGQSSLWWSTYSTHSLTHSLVFMADSVQRWSYNCHRGPLDILHTPSHPHTSFKQVASWLPSAPLIVMGN